MELETNFREKEYIAEFGVVYKMEEIVIGAGQLWGLSEVEAET